MQSNAYRSIQSQVDALFAARRGGKVGYYLDWVIMTLIVVNVTAVALETVNPIYEQYAAQFYWLEVISVAIFSIEYLGRLWACTSRASFRRPLEGRLRFAARPMLVIDLLAILPFFLGAVLPADLRFLRALRLFRFFRLFKMARYSESIRAFSRVLRTKKEDLVIAFSATLVLLLVASSMMYFVENSAQPDQFSSIPETLWWGVVTLTTVGYGDIHPVTPLGQFVGSIVALLGIGLFALPASILASGFIEEARRDTDRGGPTYCPHCGEKLE
ncbi:ion transporter [Saliphagus sp. GCM10025334]